MPKYSPDLNDIEYDFSVLKRAIMYSNINTCIDEIMRNYFSNNVSFFLNNYIKTASFSASMNELPFDQ